MVFKLLESVYGEFDKIAKSMGVSFDDAPAAYLCFLTFCVIGYRYTKLKRSVTVMWYEFHFALLVLV